LEAVMTASPARRPEERACPAFTAPYAPPDEELAAVLLGAAQRGAAAEARIDARATRLVEAIRADSGGLGGIEDFLREYSLSTREGLALMVLAEALLRVPDSATADRLIEDKLSSGDWTRREVKSSALLVSASAWALGLSARIIQPGETPENILESLGKRLGLPAVRTATRQAMRLLGSHFVLGQSIEEALARAAHHREFRYSYDMLGEGARNDADAQRYFSSYARAIDAIGLIAGNAALPDRPGISVKLSALHPRYEAVSRERVLRELTPRVLELARKAKAHDLNFTIDAEEADRLELSLDVIGAGAVGIWLMQSAFNAGPQIGQHLVKGRTQQGFNVVRRAILLRLNQPAQNDGLFDLQLDTFWRKHVLNGLASSFMIERVRVKPGRHL